MSSLAQHWASLPQISNVRAASGGDWAFWCWAGPSETDEVYAVRTDGAAPPEQLTIGHDHFTIRDTSPDGRKLILAQSRHACEHDHLLLLDRDAGNSLTQITPEQTSHYLYGGIFADEGRAVIFTANFDYATGLVTKGGWIWHQDIATGARQVLARSDTPFETGPLLSPSGQHLLWSRHERAPAGTQLWVLGVDGSNLREVLNLGETSNARGDWISDSEIAFVADKGGRDRVGVLDLSTGVHRWLAGEPELLPHEVIAGQAGQFACVTHRGSNTEAVIFQADGSSQPLPNRSARRSLLPHATMPDGGWIAESYDADGPHALVRILPDGACLTLAEAPTEPARTYIRPQEYRWTAPDGTACQGWLYRPLGAARGLIAYVHGGPTWHSEDWVNPKIGFWVQSGFTVLDVNYRGSTGFGRTYREAVKDDGWGGREQGDIRAGIEALVAEGIAKPGRIGIAGNSYGGFSSWVAITRFADLVNAAIPMCGMYRLDIDYNATEMPHGRAYSEEMMGGRPDELPEKYAQASPGNFIDQIKGHLMIVHGMADSNVGPENTLTAVRELTAAGIPHEVMLFDDEGHGVFRRTNVAQYLARSGAFFTHAFEGK